MLIARRRRTRGSLACLALFSAYLLSLLLSPAAAQAQGTGSVSGTVTAQATGAPLQGICVSPQGVGFGDDDVTDASGHYQLTNVEAGNPDFTVEFRGCGQNYVREYYDDKPTYALADKGPIPEGEDTGPVNAALATGGTISGTVTGDTVTPGPIGGVCVNAAPAAPGLESFTVQTNASGNYQLVGLASSNYTIQFFPCSSESPFLPEYYNDKATAAAANPVAVSAGSNVNNVNAVLTTGGKLTGTVLGSDGDPAEGACVNVQGTGAEPISLSVIADVDGKYEHHGLPTDDYRVSFDPCDAGASGDVGEYYDNELDFASADPVHVTAGATTSGINAQFGPGGTISGTVTAEAGGAGLQGICVRAVRPSDGLQRTEITDAAGDYSFSALPLGTWKISFNEAQCAGPNGYAAEWHSNEATEATADPIVVGAGSTADVDAAMAVGGTISGQVFDGTTDPPTPFDFVCVSLYAGSSTTPYRQTVADQTGYQFIGLPAGNYKVGFEGNCASPDFPNMFYDDARTLAGADPIAVTLGNDVTGIDATLMPLPSVIITGGLGPDNDSTPTFTFNGTYATSTECSIDTGTASFGPCTDAVSHTAGTLADGTYTFRVRVTNSAGTATETGQFTVDTVAPGLTITGGPSGLTSDTTPTFTYDTTGLGTGGVMNCKYDPGPIDETDFDGCVSATSDTPLSPLSPDGIFTFRVFARDAAGNVSPERQRTFVLETVPPAVSITSGPSGPTDDTTPTFGFTGEEGATFSCSIDAGTAAFAPCSAADSHTPGSALAPGGYTFRVRARDAAGNTATDTRAFSVNQPPVVPPPPPPPDDTACEDAQSGLEAAQSKLKSAKAKLKKAKSSGNSKKVKKAKATVKKAKAKVGDAEAAVAAAC